MFTSKRFPCRATAAGALLSATLAEQLFGTEAAADPGVGVFVTVHEGRIVLAQGPTGLTLDAGESAFAGQSLVPIKLFNAPSVLDRDPFLSSGKFSANMCRR